MRRYAILAAAAAFACSAGAKAEKKLAPPQPAGNPVWKESAAPPASSLPEFNPQQSLAPLVKKLKPTVVNISARREARRVQRRSHGRRQPQFAPGDPFEEFFGHFFGDPSGGGMMIEPERQSLGSGFILNGDGVVVTNNHVIDRADEVKVVLDDGREFSAKVVGRDPETDVALLRMEGAPKDLPTVVLGDSDKLEVGDWVIAIGNPFRLGHTVTTGIVSAKERSIGAGKYDDFIQTDAAINPGNSGGPLFNLRGEVVGINAAILNPTGMQSNIGIGFAIPSNLAKSVMEPILAGGHVVRGYLGVDIQPVTEELAKALGLARPEGALVAQVREGSPAQKAGLRDGDVVLAVGGKHIAKLGDLPKYVGTARPGSGAKLTIFREKARRELDVVIGEMPGQGGAQGLAIDATPGKSSSQAGDPLGLARLEGVSKYGGGVEVLALDEDGPAAGALSEGDVVVAVNQQRVRSLAEYSRAVATIRSGQNVLLKIVRDDSPLFIVIQAR
ncbi:MAG: Do family serine endopeptidase [Myxococcota bacterium]